jgi:hypothetical protein
MRSISGWSLDRGSMKAARVKDSEGNLISLAEVREGSPPRR